MDKLSLVFLMGFIFTLTACSDYIANKREGLKPITLDEQQEAQEENREDKER